MPPSETGHPAIRRPLVIASIMSAMFMVALEATIVSTAMPQIVGQLGGLQLYSWVFSAFLLTQTATTVVFGKLSDIYGRRPILLLGIVVFLVGSVLCGLARSMPALIAFRLIQGVGAGAITPVTMTIVGDLYSARERGQIQGWLASVWGVSAILGPLAGGLIVAKLSWAWVFWINVPLGLVAMAGFATFLHETAEKRREAVDVAGAALFAVAVAALMVALNEVGHGGWAEVTAAFAAFVLATFLFVRQERRAPDPMIRLSLWGRRPVAVANGTQLLSGMALIGLTTFLPIYVQGVLNRTALVAGFALTAMVVGWPVGATISARASAALGVRPVMLAGGLLLPAGSIAFLVLNPASSPILAGAGSLVMGLGMGLTSTAGIVLVQEIVTWSERGAATASNIFARNLGSTLGAAVLGSLFNLGLNGHADRDGPIDSGRIRALLEAGSSGAVDPVVRATMDGALHLAFQGVFALSLLVGILVWFLPDVQLGRAAEVRAAE